MNNNLIDFCSYIQPIVNGCLGFVKSNGYMTHFPGTIVAMSSDETVCVIIKIPVVYDVYMTSSIGRFLQLKTPEEQLNLFNEIYFTGWNIKQNSLIKYFNIYSKLNDYGNCIFEEPNCMNIPNFPECVSLTSINNVNISDGIFNYKIPVSKSITQLSKADSLNLRLYNCAFDKNNINIRTVRYNMYKKKFKLNVDIFTNILII